MRAVPTFLVAMAFVASACSANGPSAAPVATVGSVNGGSSTPDVGTSMPSTGTDPTSGSAGRFVRALTPFSDCSAFLDHVKAEARERVGPYGLGNEPWYWLVDDVARLETAEMAAEDATAGPAAQNAGSDGDSGGVAGTNVQEAGVDEPDLIKTDGTRILAVSENRLSYIDVSGDPMLTDTIEIPEGWGHELFFLGDRALLFTNAGQWGYPMPLDVAVDRSLDAEAEFATPVEPDVDFAPERYAPATVIIEVDLTDPTDLTITATMRIKGQYLSARAIDDRVRLAVTSPPDQLPWLFPQNENGEDRATAANRAIIDESTLEDWLPSFELTADGNTVSGPLLSCDRMHHPAEFSGFDLISVVDLDLATGLGKSFDRADAVGVMASGQTVYSSTDRFYIATTKWAGADVAGDDSRLIEWSDDFETDLHAFAISPGEPTRYVATGTIEGSLLNQFSLDEHDGYLRVITTAGSPWNQDDLSETRLVVLQEQGDVLVPVGEVGGLGKGESLFSARLMDDIGFAVTFRQTDPFYVLDLSDPTNPRVSGELKIPGFSTYLHPISADRVLGVGQNATEQGGTTGLKLSLFDVSDPSDPREISVWTLDNSNSPVEYDHRAFQMWGDTAIVPVQAWNGEFNGAVLFDIGDAITEIGRISHTDDNIEPTSDCRALTLEDVPEETELWWMVNEGYGRVQLCDSDDRGGFGGWYCDPIPVEELEYWFGDPTQVEDVIGTLGAGPGDRIETCWPDGGYQDAIQRSLVIDGTLWTSTPSTIQANHLDGLAVLARFPLR